MSGAIRVRSHELLDRAVELHGKGEWQQAELLYNRLLDRSPQNPGLLYYMGDLQARKGNHGLAIALLSECIDQWTETNPGDVTLAAAYNSLGIALKKVGRDKDADMALRHVERLMPGNSLGSANLSGNAINAGTPQIAIDAARKALSFAPDDIHAEYHLALGLLELNDWARAWPHFEARKRLPGNSSSNIKTRNYHGPDGMTPWWGGKPSGLLAIHGEQGLGDEILFASCLPDMRPLAKQVVLECAPRLAGLMARSFPWLRVNGTHKLDGAEWVPELGPPDAKEALGSLPKYFRTSAAAFPRVPYLVADPARRVRYRERLGALPKRPNIGISWQGGTPHTRADFRSIHPPDLAPILRFPANWISLQYTGQAALDIAEVKAETGVEIHHWPEAAMGLDMDDQAALIAELDLVISVCQTAIHVAGGLGVPCWVLVPSRPAWRYGIAGDRSAWYSDAQQYWRQQGDDWAPIIEQVAEAMYAHFGKLQAA